MPIEKPAFRIAQLIIFPKNRPFAKLESLFFLGTHQEHVCKISDTELTIGFHETIMKFSLETGKI